MKIVIVTDAWKPQMNGVVRTLSQIVDDLRHMGHQVFVVEPSQFATLPCPTYPEIRIALRPRNRVAMFIKNIRPDAIHIATEGPLGWAARSHCIKNKIPFTTAFHTRFPEYVEARLSLPPVYVYSILKKFHDTAQRTMCTTPSMIKSLQNYGFQNLKLWTRGVNARLFRPLPSVLDLPRPIFMNVGRVAVEKNLESFLSLDLPGSKVIVGDGPQLAELRDKYPDAHFLGAKFGEELAQCYASADVFCFPSRTDTFGLVMLEALASGTPVAAYPVSGPIDVITDRRVGVLDDDLKRACMMALELRGEDCRDFAVQRSWQASSQQFASHLAWLRPPEPEIQPEIRQIRWGFSFAQA